MYKNISIKYFYFYKYIKKAPDSFDRSFLDHKLSVSEHPTFTSGNSSESPFHQLRLYYLVMIYSTDYCMSCRHLSSSSTYLLK